MQNTVVLYQKIDTNGSLESQKWPFGKFDETMFILSLVMPKSNFSRGLIFCECFFAYFFDWAGTPEKVSPPERQHKVYNKYFYKTSNFEE